MEQPLTAKHTLIESMDSATQRRASTSTSSSHGHRKSVKRLTEGLFSFLHLYPNTQQHKAGHSDDELHNEIFSQSVKEFYEPSKRLVKVPHKLHNCHGPINFQLILHTVSLTGLLFRSNMWKWIVLFNMVWYGYPLISMVTQLLDHFMCNNSWVKKKREGVYFIKGMRQSVNLVLFSSLLLLVWLLWFRTGHRMKKTDYTHRLLHLGTWSSVEVAVLLVLKNVLLLMLEAHKLYGRFSAMISSAWSHLYVLALICGWHLRIFRPQSTAGFYGSLDRERGSLFAAKDAKLCEIKMMAQCFIDLAKVCSRGDDETPNILLQCQKIKMHHPDFIELSKVCSRGDDETPNILLQCQKIKMHHPDPFLQVEHFRGAYKLSDDDAKLVYDVLIKDLNHQSIKYEMFENSMVKAHKNCVSLGHTLLDAKEVIGVLSSVMNALLLPIVSIGWLLLFNIATIKLLVLLASALLLFAAFAFRGTCKMMFEGIKFSLIKHPFNVGDRCIIDERQLEVKRMGIMSTTFAVVGTNDEALYPNSVLISKPISTLKAFDSTEERSITKDHESSLHTKDENCDLHSLGSWKDDTETNSLGSWRDGADGGSDPAIADPAADSFLGELAANWLAAESSTRRKSWADMAQEDELERNEESPVKQSKDASQSSEQQEMVLKRKTELSRDQREYLRFMNVKREKDFICLERINGKIVNIVKGLELHTGVFSAVEQKRIVEFIGELQQKGKKGELKERTFTAPKKWMRGKGRETIQFGCCYNYATDKDGNPPGILRDDLVDPIPPLFKVIIRRLVRWHVIPQSCVPDSCIVNIYEEGDCIPPHIDNHDFIRPFCTISFVSKCQIVFGTDLKIVGPGEFSGPFAITLPVGSVLVLNGNGADVAKHCVPAVSSKRISITFRRMDENKRPNGYSPEPDLQGLQPLSYETETTDKSSPHQHISRQTNRRGFKPDPKRFEESSHLSNNQHGPSRSFRTRANRGS